MCKEITEPGILQFFWLIGHNEGINVSALSVADKLRTDTKSPTLQELRRKGVEVLVDGWRHYSPEAVARDESMAPLLEEV